MLTEEIPAVTASIADFRRVTADNKTSVLLMQAAKMDGLTQGKIVSHYSWTTKPTEKWQAQRIIG